MITSTELHRKLRRDLGDKIYTMVDEEFYEEIITEESLRTFSEYYPYLVNLEIKQENAIPYMHVNGTISDCSRYKLPPTYIGMGEDDKLLYFDVADYYIAGNDLSNVYMGGNPLMSNLFAQAASNMPHARSYYNIEFTGPDIITVRPRLMAHRDFQIQMKAERTLMQVPRNLLSKFLRLVVCDVKIAIYNKFKYSSGTQTYAGIEIDTKIDDLKDAENERREIIESFEKDWILNYEQFDIANLFMTK